NNCRYLAPELAIPAQNGSVFAFKLDALAARASDNDALHAVFTTHEFDLRLALFVIAWRVFDHCVEKSRLVRRRSGAKKRLEIPAPFRLCCGAADSGERGSILKKTFHWDLVVDV